MAEFSFKDVISIIGYTLETVGVLVILLGSLAATARMLRRFRELERNRRARVFRRDIAQNMMLGLEFLVAGDIIRTVIVSNTLPEVLSLGLIVLIRTVLVFTIHLEVEGRWPWQSESSRLPETP